jgi:hypothetical protein
MSLKKKHINLELPIINTIEIGIPEKLIKSALYNPKEFNTFTKTGNIRRVNKKQVIILTAIPGSSVKIISEGIIAANKISDRRKELDDYTKEILIKYQNKPKDEVLERLNEQDRREREKEKEKEREKVKASKSKYQIPSYMFNKHVPDSYNENSYSSRYDYLD